MKGPDTILCTVGTSFLGNIKSLPGNYESFKKHKLGKDTVMQSVKWSHIQQLLKYHKEDRWEALGRAMVDIPDDAMLCGAEINSIASLFRREFVKPQYIVFLISDTGDGQNMGKMLQAYFKARSRERGIKQVKCERVEKLQDKVTRDFKTHGLRNLVRLIGKEIQLSGDHSRVAINATGGYKAQIAVAVLIGQALDIPVYYKHELFNEVISFPPMPVSFDYDLLGRYSDLLAVFEKGEVLTQDSTGPMVEKMRALLEEISVNGQVCWELSAIGQIYLTGFRLRHPRPSDMSQATDDQRSAPSFRDDHYPEGFKQYVNKVWRETKWITTCHSLPYNGQQAIKRIGFHLVPSHIENGREVLDRIIGTYIDHTGFGARFAVLTTGTKITDLVWAVDMLNQRYSV